MRYTGRKDGKTRETHLDYHLCTEKDFVDFAPPTPDAGRALSSILNDPKRGLYCLDWEKYGEVLRVWGIS